VKARGFFSQRFKSILNNPLPRANPMSQKNFQCVVNSVHVLVDVFLLLNFNTNLRHFEFLNSLLSMSL